MSRLESLPLFEISETRNLHYHDAILWRQPCPMDLLLEVAAAFGTNEEALSDRPRAPP